MTFLDEDAFASDSYPFDFDLSAKMTLMDLLLAASKGQAYPDLIFVISCSQIAFFVGKILEKRNRQNQPRNFFVRKKKKTHKT